MQLITTHVILKSDIGVHDNLFGGAMMSFIDLAGAAFASETAKSSKMVTKKISEVIFHAPVKVNSLLKIYGEVIRIGNTSLTLKLEARRVDVQSTNEILVCSAEVVFVKINAYGEPCPIKPPKTEVLEIEAPEKAYGEPVLKTEPEFKLHGKRDSLSDAIRIPEDAERFMDELDMIRKRAKAKNNFGTYDTGPK